MAIATQNDIREIFSSDAVAARKPANPSQELVEHSTGALELSEQLATLVALLEEDPVDLARVSEEIRSQPELADAVRRVAACLQFAPGETVSSVEEAAIVLGTGRLRALLLGWRAFQKAFQRGTGTDAAQPDTDGQVASALSAESLYLASFARLLGLGNHPTTATSTETLDVSEMLLRDFLTLLPAINLQLLAAAQRCAR